MDMFSFCGRYVPRWICCRRHLFDIQYKPLLKIVYKSFNKFSLRVHSWQKQKRMNISCLGDSSYLFGLRSLATECEDFHPAFQVDSGPIFFLGLSGTQPDYRVANLLANLGWVDFDFLCSTILPTSSASSANFPSAQAEPGRGGNSQNQSQPN